MCKKIRYMGLIAVLALAPSVTFGSASPIQEGIASYYGNKFHGRKTASGERFDQSALTAAHKSLPLGTKVRVTHIKTGDSVVVRINDRGPFVKGRVIDLSRRAARELGMLNKGTARVRVEVMRPSDG